MTKKYASPRLAGLANAVLRNYLRSDRGKLLPTKDDDLRQYLHLALSFPEWLVDYLLVHFSPQEAEAFCLHANQHHGIAIRTNTLKVQRDELVELLAAEEITAELALSLIHIFRHFFSLCRCLYRLGASTYLRLA